MTKNKKARKAKSVCPCGSGLALEACCGRYLSGEAAPTPEALMRSRYTAYAVGDDAYVLETWAPETRPSSLFDEGDSRPKWISLEILSSSEENSSGTVSFVAKARTSAGAMTLRELSRFRKEDGRWLYVDGDLS